MGHEKYKHIGHPLTKAIEECAEFVQIACKIDRFGWDNYHPEDPAKISNRELLRRERRNLVTFEGGNKSDGKHYWLTPDDLMNELQKEFAFDFDPCPHPKPNNFDGLKAEWGKSNYVNPPFGAYIDKDGKKKGPTAWVRKAIEEYTKGKQIVLVYPIDKWVHMLLEAGAQVRNLKDIRWRAIEDGSQGPGTGRWVAMFILVPKA